MCRMDRNNPSAEPIERLVALRWPAAARVQSVVSSGHPILSTVPFLFPTTMSSQHHSSSPNLVGGHYRVGRKIGEGSFGVIFEGLLSFLPLSPRPLLPT